MFAPALLIVQVGAELFHTLPAPVALVVLVPRAGIHTVPFLVRVPYHVHALYHVLRVLLSHNTVIVGNKLED